jgi:hypothetical protein
METNMLDPEFISGVVGFILAVAFAYFPKLSTWYAGLQTEIKSLIMIGLLLTTTVAITLLTIYAVIPTPGPITWFSVVKIFFAALIINQPTYVVLPESKSVTKMKEARIS